MTKFNVGDKVRILDASKIGYGENIEEGLKYEVINVNSFGGIRLGVGGKKYFYIAKSELPYVEKVSKKSQRISNAELAIKALQAELAEVKAEVATLKQAQKPSFKLAGEAEIFFDGKSIGKAKAVTATILSANEQRKATIAEAKAFVEDAKNFTGTVTKRVGYKYKSTNNIVCDAKLYVNKEKRVVTCVLNAQFSERTLAKATAKCAPDDVFNADIGKAIALGRALGLDVSRFEQAVKPTEHINGMLIAPSETAHIGSDKVMRLANRVGRDTDGVWRCHVDSGYDVGSTIIDDTDAQY